MVRKSNIAFEADAVRQHIVSCYDSAPRGSMRRYTVRKKMNSKKQIIIMCWISLIVSIAGCTTRATPEAMISLNLKDTTTASGCQFITNKQLSSCKGIGAPAQLRNVKNSMLNTVIKEKGNAYIINEWSSGTGRCGSVDFDIYRCPKDYNQHTYIRIDENPKNESIEIKLRKLKELYKDNLITEEEYKEKRKLLLNNF